MNTCFEGMNEVADEFLLLDDTWAGTPPRFSHFASLLRLSKSPALFRNENLIDRMSHCCEAAWRSATELQHRRVSADSWGCTKHLELCEDNPSSEVVLERLLARLTPGNWWNQVPVDAGSLDGQGRRKIDLVHRSGDRYSIVELKVNSNTPLSAAIQVIQYGVAYLLFRQCVLPDLLERGDADSPAIMQATELDLVVLAPTQYYDRFASSHGWLESFERQMDSQLAGSAARQAVGISMTFRFESFPRDFAWPLNLATDASRHLQVAQAVLGRQRVFGLTETG
ncbi:hypothetical protein [Lacipirellula sp.]|uniref:hypothetical protein n=1 Tax=Lacipirellula sp. TaxID=2691419 RepID=UPI003D0BE5CE